MDLRLFYETLHFMQKFRLVTRMHWVRTPPPICISRREIQGGNFTTFTRPCGLKQIKCFHCAIRESKESSGITSVLHSRPWRGSYTRCVNISQSTLQMNPIHFMLSVVSEGNSSEGVRVQDRVTDTPLEGTIPSFLRSVPARGSRVLRT